MTITLPDLVAADVPAVRAAGRQWRQLAEVVDIAVEDLSRGTMDLPNHWSGAGAEACLARRDALCAQLGDFYQSFDEKAKLFALWADYLETGQQQVTETVRQARQDGVDIDVHTGLVSAIVVPATGPTAPAGQDTIDGYATIVTNILSQVAHRDDMLDTAFEMDVKQLSRTLADRDHAQPLPNQQWPSMMSDPKGLTLSDVAGDPNRAAQVWQDTNPVTQEQTITANPVLVGSTEGLPSRDRDAANRILMARDKQSLLIRQAQLSARGADSPALADVDRRLAAIGKLETSKGYLMSYRTGDEQNAVLGSGNTPWDTPTR